MKSLRLDVRRKQVVVIHDRQIDVEDVLETVIPESRNELVDFPIRGLELLE